jgi:alpha-ketoglutarate-dependent taurine dioxygenase
MSFGFESVVQVGDDSSNDVLVKRITDQLHRHNYVVVKNFDIDTKDIKSSAERFSMLASQIGKLEAHTHGGSLVWHVKNKHVFSKVATFSEHAGEAMLHTDTQYRDKPEDYIALCVLHAAKCGGGETQLLSIANILDELYALPNGDEILSILQATKYPFIVPSVFSTRENGMPEFVHAPIIKNGTIRFRIDTLELGIAAHMSVLAKEAIDAFLHLKKIVISSKAIRRISLGPRDIVFIDNKRCLHGRSAFKDNDRHLLRIRMNKLN